MECTERVGQGEVGGVTGRLTCTWWLLWLADPWLAHGPVLALVAQISLENANLRSFISDSKDNFWLRMGVCWSRMLTNAISSISGHG